MICELGAEVAWLLKRMKPKFVGGASDENLNVVVCVVITVCSMTTLRCRPSWNCINVQLTRVCKYDIIKL